MEAQSLLYADDLAKCVLCGGCKAVCPTYDEGLSESMGARGRIRLIRELNAGRLRPSAELNERIFSCILCGACSGTCPLGVHIPEAICRGRERLKDSDRKRRYLRFLIKIATTWPDPAFRAMRMARHVILPFLARRGMIPFVPDLPDAPFRRSEQVLRVNKRKGRVAVFTGCSVNYVFPHFGESLLNVLHRFGYEVILPKGETCCGAPLRNLGLEGEAAEQARRNYRVFSRLKVDAILSLCPTCTHSLRTDYPRLIGKGLDKAMDISVFFADILDATSPIMKSAVYHDPCHLRYNLGVTREPRDIITRAGLDLLSVDDSGCCGFGGPFSLSFKDLSLSLRKKQAERLRSAGADAVVTSCPGCILQLGQEITDRPVLHLIELIEEAYCLRTEQPSLLVV